MSDRPLDQGTDQEAVRKARSALVSLRPEKLVLGSCKTAAVSGPGQFRQLSVGVQLAGLLNVADELMRGD